MLLFDLENPHPLAVKHCIHQDVNLLLNVTELVHILLFILLQWINVCFWETVHLPFPNLVNINTYFLLWAKCQVWGGVGGQFPRNMHWSVTIIKKNAIYLYVKKFIPLTPSDLAHSHVQQFPIPLYVISFSLEPY